jgi:hypothetical protein
MRKKFRQWPGWDGPFVWDASTLVELKNVELIHETKRALLIRLGQENEEWFPKTNVIMRDFDNGVVKITEWIAKKKGIQKEEG